ncbi:MULTISPECIES: ArsR/SmtB family transcription factor [Gordonia]|uniref:ArsR/SmtB family transcription factor n=1 Tax=Gordonia TaxID=2053 RepID=UPI0012BB3B8E|nr:MULTISPECIES: metalloregulator ArsR/SmtB family transcription factor [Gordonia]MDH3013663.1 metalloregulator ArsR/SmtB family transcription factor [Gordonia alkanivorans]MDH3026619.1 metalloregulator ArsR/SmtB family transcription factor [Gordonia alkanivorans]MDH3045668.1 metalloregulator ArsR/SmtB family transcription factor [Gordonia alkanivorans]MDH3050811.1 metalloregulator ArsR/SmtB family transcription factor [Gordonia alkanivorans]QGP86610.1 metalloregulator ArsR/SmtB family transcr
MDAFEAIADPTRRALVERLAQRPARVVDLAAEHPISRPAISRHLRVLGEAGVVAAVDHGRERHYELVSGGLAPVRDWLDGLASGATQPFGEHHLDALDLEVRRTVREFADPSIQTGEQKETG